MTIISTSISAPARSCRIFNKMKRWIPCILEFMMVVVLSIAGLAQGVTGAHVRSKSFAVDPGDKLVVKVRLGDVIINSWDKNTVSVTAEGIEDKYLDSLSIFKSGSLIQLRYTPAGNMQGKGRFTIQIPAHCDAAMNISHGDIRLLGSFSGRIEGSTSNGAIELDNATGFVELSTSSGGVTIGDIKGTGRFSTSRGDIAVHTVDGDIDVKTSSGNIRVESVVKNLTAHTSSGNISVGTVGGKTVLSTSGGNITVNHVADSAKIKTSGGDITLENGSGNMELLTLGGDIRIRSLAGSLRARTAEGSIDAVLSPNAENDTLRTFRGDINLTLPENARVTITAVIRREGREAPRGLNYEVVSDFPAETFKKDDDEMLVQTFRLNGGGSQVYLEAVNANITIRKRTR